MSVTLVGDYPMQPIGPTYSRYCNNCGAMFYDNYGYDTRCYSCRAAWVYKPNYIPNTVNIPSTFSFKVPHFCKGWVVKKTLNNEVEYLCGLDKIRWKKLKNDECPRIYSRKQDAESAKRNRYKGFPGLVEVIEVSIWL